MKKYLLLLLTMLTTTLGAWADAVGFGTGSSYEIDGTSITINVGTAGDYATWINGLSGETTPTLATVQACTTVTFTGTLNNVDLGNLGDITSNCTYDLTGITIAEGSEFNATNVSFAPADNKVFTVLLPSSVPVTNDFLGNNYSSITAINKSGTTANIYMRSGNFNTAGMANTPSGTEKIVIYSGGNGYNNNFGYYGTLDMRMVENVDLQKLYPSNFGSASSTLTSIDLSHIQSWNITDYTNNFINHKGDGTNKNGASWKFVVDPTNRLVANGTITASDIAFMNSNFSYEHVDFSGATFDPNADILTVNNNVKSIILSPGAQLSESVKSNIMNHSPYLEYIYSPTSDNGVTVPSRVFVCKPGGLYQAFRSETTLRSAIYVKVESYVALNSSDVDINSVQYTSGSYDNNYFVGGYQYLDLSDANITPEMMLNYKASHNNAYRMILPANWTADEMAYMGGNNNKGAIAAVYSYNGSKLNVLELNDGSYSPAALADKRIVKDGTKALEFVSGTYDISSYGTFGTNALAAVNNAALTTFSNGGNTITNNTERSIRSVKVSTSSSVSNSLTFTNNLITSLDLSGITIGSANLTTSSCTALRDMNLSGSTLASVDANGCTDLQAVTLTGTTISGAFDVSNSGITRITVDTRIGGTITATGCSSLNRITNSGTIGGDIIANGTSGAKLSNLTTFINNGTISGDVNLSYTGLTTFTNNGSVKNINLSNCDATGFTSFAPAGTINGDIDLTDCTNLTSINVANATINNQGSYNTGYSADVNFTRSSQNEVTNSVYDNLKDGDNGYNVTKASSGQDNLTIIPTVTAKTTEAASTSVSGVTEDDCALTVGISGSETLTSLLQKFYAMKNNIADYTTVTTGSGGNLSTLSICNLTVTGEINATDIATINALTFNINTGTGIVWRDAVLNLDGATLASGVTLTSNNITNATVNNIILPRNLDKDVVKAANFSSCTNLNAAVSLNAARTQVVGYVKKPGMLRQTLSQVPDFQRNPWQYMQNLNLPSVTLTGTLLACDIATGNDHVISNGNYKESPTSEEKLTGYDACGTGGKGLAFEGVNTLRNLDIADAIFVDGSDNTTIMEENMTLSQLGWAGIVSLKMPKSSQMKDVPAHFLENCKNITYVCIPYNYETIGDAAFYLAGTNWITTTDNAGAEVDNGINTYTFSKNLKQIGTDPGKYVKDETSTVYPASPTNPVFGAVNSGEIHDIYFLSSDAPKCWRGAFASGMTYGWGGFDGGNVYCREKYKNGAFLFTVLNFPQGLTEEQEKKYTDITKVYTKKDQTGAVDADGETIPWPTFSELGRSYNQAIRGLVWNDWNVVQDLQEAGNVNGGTIVFDPTQLPDANTNVSGTPDYVQFYDYVGLHEFVLSKATYVAPDETVVNDEIVRYYKQDDWYTFCIPFDMTEAQVAELLGVPATNTKVINEHSSVTYRNYLQTADDRGNNAGEVNTSILPQIITLKSVLRNSSNNTVSLRCSQDLAITYPNTYYMPSASGEESAKYISNGTVDLGAGDENIMIRAGYPYMIRPYVLCTSAGVKEGVPGNNLGKQVLTRYTFKEAASGISVNANANHADCYQEIGGEKTGEKSRFAKPYENHKVQAYSDAATSEPLTHSNGYKYNYTFIGQFWKQFLPLNSFYMSGHKWYHYTTYNSAYYWNPYVCIIMVSDENKDGADAQFRTETNNNAEANTTSATILPEEVAQDEKGHAVFNRQMEIRFLNGLSDLFTSSAREYNFVFEDDIMDVSSEGQTTAIEVLDGVRVAPVKGKVYNMAGQHVGSSLEGLAKGMYIVNGKKYVIK